MNFVLSNDRAASVAKYLNTNGVANERMKTEGKAFDEPGCR